MTQVGESVTVIPPEGEEKCVFCGKDHQTQQAAGSHTFDRDMTKLKRDGRSYTIGNRSASYPGEKVPPLTDWQKDITKTGGYKGAAHHCVALKTASEHKMSGELHGAGYDPNDGSNCMWLPYSRAQFIRARAYHKALQKHRGGHTDSYFQTVARQIEDVSEQIEKEFCPEEAPDKSTLIRYMKVREARIWFGIANTARSEYHLYNDSYLDPKLPWGSYPEEQGATEQQFLGVGTSPADDGTAESESADDPE